MAAELRPASIKEYHFPPDEIAFGVTLEEATDARARELFRHIVEKLEGSHSSYFQLNQNRIALDNRTAHLYFSLKINEGEGLADVYVQAASQVGINAIAEELREAGFQIEGAPDPQDLFLPQLTTILSEHPGGFNIGYHG